uniref:Fas associated factor family member 2 n=1 Tax=Mus musculus TaxID=10090 RepID=D6RE51_MOUSE
MAAPEEQDLTQEQTEKLLQFQVAASSRCSPGRRGMGSGTLEERKTILRI